MSVVRSVDVYLWGTKVGSLGYDQSENGSSSPVATFVYDEEFRRFPVEISPLTLDSKARIHKFSGRDHSYRTFKGLPGVFADSLPDTFGNNLIDVFYAAKGLTPSQITPLDRIMYTGDRAMGALEYKPSALPHDDTSSALLDLPLLTELASLVNKRKDDLSGKLASAETRSQALSFVRVGSSAGGARPKALVATKGGVFRDGSIDQGLDHDYWLLKFDSEGNSDRDGADPKGLTKIEYIYSLIARNAGINIPRTDYVADGDNFHFLIERFDRVKDHARQRLDKLHYVSWCGIAHAHRDSVGAYSYTQLAQVCSTLGLPASDKAELFKRTVFNIAGRNQDDHTKNFGFVMNRAGEWALSPAFDLTYAFDPMGRWTNQHQIQMQGKQDNFARDDLLEFAKQCGLTRRQGDTAIDSVLEAFQEFGVLARKYDVPQPLLATVEANLRVKQLLKV